MSYESADIGDLPQSLTNLDKASASFDRSVIAREEVRFNSQAISHSEQARDIVIRMNSAGYLDMSTLYLYLDLKVKHSGSQILDDGILKMFGQCILSVQGKVVERVEDASELLALVHHTCTPEWLRTEGKMAGMTRYVPSQGVHMALNNDKASTSTDGARPITAVDGFVASGWCADTGSEDNQRIVNPPSGSGYSTNPIAQNTSGKGYAGTTWLHNSTNVYGRNGNDQFWNELPEGTNNGDGTARTYCLSLATIFGLVRQQASYFPLRNCNIEIRLQLKPYATWAIHVPPCYTSSSGKKIYIATEDLATTDGVQPATTALVKPLLEDLNSSSFHEYTVSNVHCLADIVTPAPEVVESIDRLVASDGGLQLVFETYTMSKSSVARTTDINLQASRSYSHLKDIYTIMRPVDLESNVWLRKSDTWYGSLVDSVSTTVGSKVMPSSNPQDSPAEMFASLRKSLSLLGASGSSRGVVSFNAYQGIPEGIYNGTYKQAMYSGMVPDLATARTSGGFTATGADAGLKEKLIQAHQIPSQAHSSFVIGFNTQRVLTPYSLSGLNTIGQSFTVNTRIRLKPYADALQNSNVLASVNNTSLDSCWGDTNISCTQIFHSDNQLIVAQNGVTVVE